MSQRIVFIGAGNLGTRLAVELNKKGFIIEQVYSRTHSSANLLASKINSHYTTSPWKIMPGADIYFVALKDSAFDEVLPYVPLENQLLVHCSGSMPLTSIKQYSKNTGVFYPLQTFSRTRHLRFAKIPVFVEANSEKNQKKLLEIAKKISGEVSVLDSDARLNLHIAAVFACNFVNHFYTVAFEILKQKGVSFDVLKPLIMETAQKVQKMNPENAQTGPAVRFDKNVISAHQDALIDFPEYRDIYKRISKSIFNYHKNI
jgi:predicted short-subunit dehydrogenase-like oxidoreductase (DUF2520 family)